MRDPYEVLGVARSAAPEEIRQAYRGLAKGSHPDLHPGDAKAEARVERESRAAERAATEAEERDYKAAHKPGGKKERGRSENLDPEIDA